MSNLIEFRGNPKIPGHRQIHSSQEFTSEKSIIFSRSTDLNLILFDTKEGLSVQGPVEWSRPRAWRLRIHQLATTS
jgi:hypothetical protein